MTAQIEIPHERIADFCQRYNIRRMALFGSVIRDDFTPESDSDRMFNLDMVRLLEVIGEAARRVPEEFRSRYTEVPWRRTTDFRNRLIHGYDVIDFDTVWDIVKNELSPLIEQLEEIISESPRSGC